MKPSDVAKLAAGLAAGNLTAEEIHSEHGGDVLNLVLAAATGGVAGAVVGKMVGGVMDATGVSDFLDDIFG